MNKKMSSIVIRLNISRFNSLCFNKIVNEKDFYKKNEE